MELLAKSSRLFRRLRFFDLSPNQSSQAQARGPGPGARCTGPGPGPWVWGPGSGARARGPKPGLRAQDPGPKGQGAGPRAGRGSGARAQSPAPKPPASGPPPPAAHAKLHGKAEKQKTKKCIAGGKADPSKIVLKPNKDTSPAEAACLRSSPAQRNRALHRPTQETLRASTR